MRKTYFAILISILFSFITTYAQKVFQLKVISVDHQHVINKMKFKTSFYLESDVKKQIKKIVSTLRSDGNVLANNDSTFRDSLNFTAYISVGAKYKLSSIKKGNADDGMLSSIRFRERFFHDIPFKFKSVDWHPSLSDL